MRGDSVFVLKIDVQARDGYFYAASPDLPGLHVCGDTADSVRASALLAVKTLLKRNRNLDVEVRPVAPNLDAFPASSSRFDRVAVQSLPC